MKSYFYIIISMVIWSSYSIILKKVDLDPVIFTFTTNILGGVFIYLYGRTKNISFKISNKNKLMIFFTAIFILINSISFFYAYKLTSVSNAVFSHYLAPIFVSIAAPILIKERVEYKTLISLILAIMGMYFIFFQNSHSFNISRNDLLGILLGTLSAVCYALVIIIVKHLIKSSNYIVMIIYQDLSMLFISLLASPIIFSDFDFSLNILIVTLLVAFTHCFIAPLFYLKGLESIKAQYAGLLGYTEVLSSILLGIIFLKEIPNMAVFVGGLLIVISGGILIVSAKQTE